MTELTASRIDYNLTTKTNDYTLSASKMDYMLTTIYTATATSNQDARIEDTGYKLAEDGTFTLAEDGTFIVQEAGE